MRKQICKAIRNFLMYKEVYIIIGGTILLLILVMGYLNYIINLLTQ